MQKRLRVWTLSGVESEFGLAGYGVENGDGGITLSHTFKKSGTMDKEIREGPQTHCRCVPSGSYENPNVEVQHKYYEKARRRGTAGHGTPKQIFGQNDHVTHLPIVAHKAFLCSLLFSRPHCLRLSNTLQIRDFISSNNMNALTDLPLRRIASVCHARSNVSSLSHLRILRIHCRVDSSSMAFPSLERRDVHLHAMGVAG